MQREFLPNAFSSLPCKLGYRFLPWNLEMENLVGELTGIEPLSPAIWADMLTTTPQHPGNKCIKFASSNNLDQYIISQTGMHRLIILLMTVD